MVEDGFRLERLGRGEPGDLSRPYAEPSTVVTAETQIAQLLRRNPSRVGPVVALLSQLRDALPQLYEDGVGQDVDDSDDASDLYLSVDAENLEAEAAG